jgi:hypothetical protein
MTGFSKLAVNHSAVEPPPRLAQRDGRRAVEMRAFVVRPNNEIVDVRILDLSYNGCGIETPVPLSRNEVLKLSALGRGSMAAKVRWYKSRKAGLLFISEEAGDAARQARVARMPVAAEAFLRRSGKLRYRVTASDLSPNGCRCGFVDRPEIDERVWIKFKGLEALECQVTWIAGFEAGLSFCTPLHSAVFAMLVQRLGVSAS